MTLKAKMSSSLKSLAVTLDANQASLFELFRNVAESINKKPSIRAILTKLIFSNIPQGIYLSGDVGRGKTMLMERFFDLILVKKEIIHFQRFMQELHQKMHKFQVNKPNDKAVKNLADEITARVKVLCIDEFEIKDITDAMLVMRLFAFLALNGVFIFLTTNIKPDYLYKEGLQRESFLPFIENVKKNFMVLDLNTEKDYRLEKVAGTKDKILFPINDANKAIFSKIKNNLCREEELYPGKFEVFGREVTFNTTHQNILFTNFNELFTRDFSYADYVNLCQRFKIIAVEEIRQISEDETDIVTRFINFIDNAYFYKVALFALFEAKPSLIYIAGKRSSEFQRTVSRLNEMNNNEEF